MNINVTINNSLKIPAFYLFFIIHGIQTGVGIMGVPRYIFSKAYQDSWISILLALIFMIIVAYIMLLILKQYENADIFNIQIDIFGSWIGKLFGTVYILFFAATLISVILTYIQVIQIFLYPTIPSFVVTGLLIFLVIYIVSGGIKTLVGVTFIFVILSQWILILAYDPISRMDWAHFLPMFQASIPDLLQGVKATTYSVTGFEILFVIYPFISNKEKAKLPVILGLCYTTFLILSTTAISIGYFSARDLGDIEWSTITLFKNVSYTFVERLDYLLIAEWMMVIIPNIAIYMWAITIGMKRLYKIPQRITLYTTSFIVLIVATVIKSDIYINKLTDTLSSVGFWLIFIYPFVLLPLVILKKKWRKRKGSV